jgi:hypothetical protein
MQKGLGQFPGQGLPVATGDLAEVWQYLYIIIKYLQARAAVTVAKKIDKIGARTGVMG